MIPDVISIPVRYASCEGGVEFEPDALAELVKVAKEVERRFGGRLDPVGLTDGYAHYRLIAPPACGDKVDTPPDVDCHVSVDKEVREEGVESAFEPHSRRNEQQGQDIPALPTGSVTQAVLSDATDNAGRMLLIRGRPVMAGDSALLLPDSANRNSEPRPKESGWVILEATGETYLDCRLVSRERYMLHEDQLPSDVAIGDEIEVQGVRSESITVADAESAAKPQLDLDLAYSDDESGED